MNGGEERLSRRPFPIITGWETASHPLPRFCAPTTWSSCTRSRGEGGREPGRRGLMQWVGPSRLPFLRFYWRSEAAVSPLRPFIRSKRGQRKSALHLLPPSASGFLPPSAMEGGNPGSSSVAARVSARQRALPPLAPTAAEPVVRGRGRGRGCGRGRGRGRGARGGRIGAPSSPPPAAPFLPAVHLGDDPCEFIIT